MGPEILSSTGAGVWRKAPRGFPDSSSVLDKFQSAKRPAARLPKKIHTYCDSRLCVLDVSEQKTYSLELTDGLPIHGPSDWDKIIKD